MNIHGILQIAYDWPLSELIRTNYYLFPALECLHVICVTLVTGSVFIVDLRLLGITSNKKPVTELANEVLPWTWGLFVVAVIAGSMLFISKAPTYYDNTAFRYKMLFIVLAGINMVVFHFLTFKSVEHWDRDVPTLVGAKVAGGLSVLLWIAVVCCGRWIGFTII
jgi:hypothetical protein